MLSARHFLAGLILSGILVTVAGCATIDVNSAGHSGMSNNETRNQMNEEQANAGSHGDAESGQKRESRFALQVEDRQIRLQDWDNQTNLEEILGKPLSQETETLENADTMTGSFVKKLTYEGLYLELFSPKQNGKTFWIMTMKATAGPFETPEGIRVGSTVGEMKKAYEGIAVIDGRTDPNNAAYRVSDEERYNYLECEVTEGMITEIRIFHLIP